MQEGHVGAKAAKRPVLVTIVNLPWMWWLLIDLAGATGE